MRPNLFLSWNLRTKIKGSVVRLLFSLWPTQTSSPVTHLFEKIVAYHAIWRGEEQAAGLTFQEEFRGRRKHRGPGNYIRPSFYHSLKVGGSWADISNGRFCVARAGLVRSDTCTATPGR